MYIYLKKKFYIKTHFKTNTFNMRFSNELNKFLSYYSKICFQYILRCTLLNYSYSIAMLWQILFITYKISSRNRKFIIAIAHILQCAIDSWSSFSRSCKITAV